MMPQIHSDHMRKGWELLTYGVDPDAYYRQKHHPENKKAMNKLAVASKWSLTKMMNFIKARYAR
jgi:hypothetical protein